MTALALLAGRRGAPLLATLAALFLAGCGINTVPTAQERAKAAWSEVQNQYQRRADLIPNLVETVRGYAKQEKDVLEAVVNARARATAITVTPETLSDPEKFKQFQEALKDAQRAIGQDEAVARDAEDFVRPGALPRVFDPPAGEVLEAPVGNETPHFR